MSEPASGTAGRRWWATLAAVIAGGLLAVVVVGPAHVAATLRLNRAIFLVTEGRIAEAESILGDLATRPGADDVDVGDGAARVLAELEIVNYPDGWPIDGDLASALSNSFSRLASYLNGAHSAPHATMADTGRSLLYPRWELPLGTLLDAYAARRWRDVIAIADSLPAPRHDGLPRIRLALAPLRSRAAFETADHALLRDLVIGGSLAGVHHADFLGPAVFLLLSEGRTDEALLLAHEAAAHLGETETLNRLKPFLGGPGGADSPLAATRHDVIAAYLDDPASGMAVDDDNDRGDDAAGAMPIVIRSVTPAGAAITATTIVDDATEASITFLSAGSVSFDLPVASERGLVAVDVVLRARGTVAEGKWPIVLLRVQEESHSRFYFASETSRTFRRTVVLDPARPATLTLSYVNNSLSEGAPEGADRNAYVESLRVVPATSSPR